MTFKVGDTVTWTSQAAGSRKTKTGVVLCVVPARAAPNDCLRAAGIDTTTTAYVSGAGYSMRNYESYVVRVGNSKECYWPLAKNLRPENPEQMLLSLVVPSNKHMEKEERAVGNQQMLSDLRMLAKNDGCIAAAWAVEALQTFGHEITGTLEDT